MNRTLLVIIITLFFYSCKSVKVRSTAEVINAIAPEEQTKSIDPTKDNLIVGEKGTNVFIPAGAFVLKDGSVPSGKVTVTLEEFYSLSDFISRDLSSVSNGNLLETGGMINLNANANGKEVEIDKTKSIVVAFPNKDTTKPMGTFYGSTDSSGRVNWQGGFQFNDGGVDEEILKDSSLYEKTISLCYYTSAINSDTVEWRLANPDSTMFEYISKKFKPKDPALLNEFCENGGFPIVHISINKEGKITAVDFDTEREKKNRTSEPLRQLITDFLKAAPPFIMSVKTDLYDYLTMGFCCHTQFNRDKYNERFEQKYTQYKDQAIKQIDKKELGCYIISVTKLGWINCDRFLDEDIEKTELFVKTADAPDSRVMIVFDDISSIMQGQPKNGAFVFPNVPINKKIRIIGVSYTDGKPLMAKQPATITKQPITLSGFKEFSLKDLQKEMNKS